MLYVEGATTRNDGGVGSRRRAEDKDPMMHGVNPIRWVKASTHRTDDYVLTIYVDGKSAVMICKSRIIHTPVSHAANACARDVSRKSHAGNTIKFVQSR